jgi:hypothetical protein
MVSKSWFDLLLWGLGDRLEGKHDYKTDILLVLDIMIWYSVISLTAGGGVTTFLLGWLLFPLFNNPAYWIGTQLGVGYVMGKMTMRGTKRQEGRRLESEEP